MTGIYDCFGYGAGYEVSFEERHRLIRDAGFDCVMLWWSDHLEPMNWDYENLSIREFLDLAYERAKRLDEMRSI